MTSTLKKIFLVHGEPDQAPALIEAIRKAFGIEAIAVRRGQSYEL